MVSVHARLECGRSWVRALAGSNLRLKEKSQELSIRPCKSVIFKVDLYMKMFGLCTISRLNKYDSK
jgi:hypothetical protein